MIRKSQNLEKAIREGAVKLLETKAERVYLPGEFKGYFVQWQPNLKLPSEPIRFSE